MRDSIEQGFPFSFLVVPIVRLIALIVSRCALPLCALAIARLARLAHLAQALHRESASQSM